MLMQICMKSIWKQKNNFVKKSICVLVMISILISFTTPVFATESEETYYRTIDIHYYGESDNDEQWDVMVKGKHVYIEFSYLSTMLGYNCKREGDLVSIYPNNAFAESRLPPISVHYKINKSVVYYNPLFGAEFEYDTPAPCIENEKGVWVPLTYTLVLLGGNSTFDNDTLIITRPRDNVLSVAARIVNNENLTSFDWENALGYEETATVVANVSARVVTLFKGLIEFDGSTWLGVVDWNAFDRKFGRSFVGLFCESSADEFREGLEEIDRLNDVFGTDGKVGQMLRNKQMRINSDVSVWKNACEEYMKVLESGSGSPQKYNLLYRQYERAMDDQDLFAALGAENAIYIQNELSAATKVLNAISIIGKGVSYYEECISKDGYQGTVLSDYLSTRSKTGKISESTAKSMYDHMSSMDNRGWYIFWSFIREEGLKFVVDESGLDAYFGIPANILLFAWDIMSNSIPFYKDGLNAIESREISNYAQKVQNDAYENINYMINKMRNNTSEINEEECLKLSEYCYVYLKACYIARSAGINSLNSISDEKKKKIKNKLDTMEDINESIARYLAVLSSSNADNERYILGFLPKYNAEFLEKRPDDGALATFAMNSDNIEISSYLEHHEQLVELLGMKPTEEYWQFWNAKSYVIDKFYLEWDSDDDDFQAYSMKNMGTSYIKLYGSSIGDNTFQVEARLLENGWVNHDSTDEYIEYIAILNDKEYLLHVYVDEDNNMTSWFLNNWPEGEWVAEDFEKLRRTMNNKNINETNIKMTADEIYYRLVEHYKKGTEDSPGDELTVMEGDFYNDNLYRTTVRCGVPGNVSASQMLYDIVVDATTGEVIQTRVLTDNKVVIFNLLNTDSDTYENLLLEFIQDGGYLEYTKDWSLPVEKYCLFDLNQDGTEELIIASEDYGSGFSDYQVYAMQNAKIVMIKDFTAFYGITYSEKYHSIVFSDTRSSEASQSRLFETYDGTKMVNIFYIQKDLSTDTWEQVYTKVEGNVINTLTEDEYMQYLTETTDITEWLEF